MTREQIETLITDNITTNSNGEITAVKVKAILDAIANDYRHSTDEITLSQVTDLVSSLAGKQATLTATNIKTIVDSLVEMTTPINADNIIVTDSAGTTAKKLSWTNIKAFLKTYFDTLYQVILVSGTNIKTVNGSSILGSGNLVISAGTDFYTTSGTLTSARTVTMSGNGLTFTGGQTTLKGSGTTSATTSLLVQNSAGSGTLSVRDDGNLNLIGSTYDINTMPNTVNWTTSGFNINIRTSTTSSGNFICMHAGSQNMSFFGGIFAIPVSGTRVIGISSGTAPTSVLADTFVIYSNDQTAGNACLHTRTENGAIVKLYQETTGVASSTFVANVGNNVKEDSTFDGYTVAQVVKALRNLGILA